MAQIPYFPRTTPAYPLPLFPIPPGGNLTFDTLYVAGIPTGEPATGRGINISGNKFIIGRGPGAVSYAAALALWPIDSFVIYLEIVAGAVGLDDNFTYSVSYSDRFNGITTSMSNNHGLDGGLIFIALGESNLAFYYINYLLRTPNELLNFANNTVAGVQPIALGLANTAITVYNGTVTLVANAYDAEAARLNAHPAVIDPAGFATTTVTQVQTIVNAQITAAVTLVNKTVADALIIVGGIKTGTVDPAIATAEAAIAAQVKFVTDTATSIQNQVTLIVNGALATITAEKTKLEAEAARLQAEASATVTQKQAEAMAAIADAQATLLTQVGVVTKAVADLSAMATTEVLRVVGSIQAQAADRPLYYGALSAAITVNGPADVVVIPPGGLQITAD